MQPHARDKGHVLGTGNPQCFRLQVPSAANVQARNINVVGQVLGVERAMLSRRRGAVQKPSEVRQAFFPAGRWLHQWRWRHGSGRQLIHLQPRSDRWVIQRALTGDKALAFQGPCAAGNVDKA